RASDEAGAHAAASFVRERRASRYNSKTGELLDAWIGIMTGGADEADVSAFGLTQNEGVDATFRITRTTAFSRASEMHASVSAGHKAV
ncbi:hypothetical protein, partial [Klebsiella pneumoniae]|uniref:hypothetical protein n=1 Tax=Klebsiella pneumoniae TaxID=573 RepID=UPI003F51ADCF